MTKRKNKVLLITSIFVLCIASIYFIPFLAIQWIGPETITTQIKQRIEKDTDRTLSFGGKTKIFIAWNLAPTIKFQQVTLSNVSWAKEKNFLEIEDLSISINLLAFLEKKIDIKKLRINNGNLYLAKKSARENNWTLSKKNHTNSLSLAIDQIKLKNIKIYFDDSLISKRQTFYIPKANLKTDHTGTPNYIYALLKHNGQHTELNSNIVRENGHLHLTDLLIQQNSNKLRGQLLLNFSDYQFTGRFQSPHWQLALPTNGAPNKRLLPDIHLPTIDFSPWSGTLQFLFNNMQYQNITLNKVNIKSKMQTNEFNHEILIDNFAGGTLTGNILYIVKNKPTLSFTLEGKNIHTERMIEYFTEDALAEGGVTHFHIYLKGSGNTLYEVLHRATGDVLFHSKNLTIKEIARLKHNILSQILLGVFPDIKKTPSSNVDCIVTHFKMSRGTASAKKGLGLESSSLYLQGSGSINLKNESIDFTFKPLFPKKIKLPIGAATNYVKLTGTLSNPKISVNPMGIVKEGGTIAAAIATGGVSLLAQGLFNTATADGSPCQTALESN